MKKTNIKNKSDFELYLLIFNNLIAIPLKYITKELIDNLFIYNNKQLSYLNERLIEEGYNL